MWYAEDDRMSRRIEKRREWEARLARWQSAGSSVRQFCREEGVNEQSFYSWRRRMSVVGTGRTRRRESPVRSAGIGSCFAIDEAID